jgi:large subunit ribosomal protein L17
MLHRISGKKLGRTRNQRQALFKGLSRAIFTYGSIETTEAKAKASIPMIEKLANTAVVGDLNAKRELFATFQDRRFVNSVVAQMQQVFGDQKSNFTVIKRVKRRQGDDALIVKLSFVKPYALDLTKKEAVKKEESAKPVKKAAAKKVVKKVKKSEVKE